MSVENALKNAENDQAVEELMASDANFVKT